MKFRLGWYLNFEDDLLTCYRRNSGNTWLCWCGPWAHGGWWRGSWAFPPLRHRPLPASYRPLPSEHPVGSQSIQSFKFNLTSEWIEKQNSDHLALLDESQELLLEGCSLWIVFGWHDDPASVFYSGGKKRIKWRKRLHRAASDKWLAYLARNVGCTTKNHLIFFWCGNPIGRWSALAHRPSKSNKPTVCASEIITDGTNRASATANEALFWSVSNR